MILVGGRVQHWEFGVTNAMQIAKILRRGCNCPVAAPGSALVYVYELCNEYIIIIRIIWDFAKRDNFMSGHSDASSNGRATYFLLWPWLIFCQRGSIMAEFLPLNTPLVIIGLQDNICEPLVMLIASWQWGFRVLIVLQTRFGRLTCHPSINDIWFAMLHTIPAFRLLQVWNPNSRPR